MICLRCGIRLGNLRLVKVDQWEFNVLFRLWGFFLQVWVVGWMTNVCLTAHGGTLYIINLIALQKSRNENVYSHLLSIENGGTISVWGFSFFFLIKIKDTNRFGLAFFNYGDFR